MAQDVLSVTTTPPLSGLALVERINDIAAALATQSSGTAAPGTTFPFQYWFDTTNNLLKLRNAANDAWVTVASLVANVWVPYHKGSAIPDIGATGGALLSTASVIAALNALAANGADIASGATLNLDNATGDALDVTGTTTITAITLSAGRTRTVRFAGALTLTHSSSLVLPGAANITTAAGDIAIFRGYAAGVVRCIGYQMAGVSPGSGKYVGEVFIWPGPILPPKCLWPDGSNVSRTTFAGVFAAYGTTHGVGNGSTTFGLPDLRGVFPLGRDDMGGTPANRVTAAVSGIAATTLGATGGAQSFTPTIGKMAPHAHGVTGHVTDSPNDALGSGRSTQPATGGSTASAGGGADQETMPPSLVLNFAIYAGV